MSDIPSSSNLRTVSWSQGEHGLGIDDLCGAAEERARNLGHRLGGWEDRSDELAAERRASCSICGKVAYVRIEPGLVGASGTALTEPCARADPAPSAAG